MLSRIAATLIFALFFIAPANAAGCGFLGLEICAPQPHQVTRHHAAKQRHAATKTARHEKRQPRVQVAQVTPPPVVGDGGRLVRIAKRYLGATGEIVGRSSLWCGAFMRKVVREAGFADFTMGNLAENWRFWGKHVSGPVIGAIAYMGRRGGGHVGVVSGIDGNGNPIIISGNHNKRVAESTYPRGRIQGYVVASN